MNVLILTARCGMGHYSASKAIEQELKLTNENVNIQTIDFYEYMFPKFKCVIYGFFNFMVKKCSHIYNFFYRYTSKKAELPIDFKIIRKIRKLIENNKIDLVISTFPVCSAYVSKYKKKYNKNIKLYTYITDIDVNEEWIADETDIYCVASQKTKQELISKNVKDDKIIITGIPIKENFKRNQSLLKNNNLKKEILIMGGGLGLIPSVENIIINLVKEKNIHITLIAGTNKKVVDKYKDRFDNIDVIGYTNEVNTYMNKADLIISKAGGVTMFEAIYSNTPLYIITPFLSQEVGNAIFIEENEIGKVVWNKNFNTATSVLNLLHDDNAIYIMKHNMQMIQERLEEQQNVLELCGEGAI